MWKNAAPWVRITGWLGLVVLIIVVSLMARNYTHNKSEITEKEYELVYTMLMSDETMEAELLTATQDDSIINRNEFKHYVAVYWGRHPGARPGG